MIRQREIAWLNLIARARVKLSGKFYNPRRIPSGRERQNSARNFIQPCKRAS
ncbi:hypothetical protein [uncultured Campylobacter sp.]|uniref:hypothetical protein n=1 Tax=uncultured Campylobacter sp. TaxID=218934 RepID=UPI00261A8BFC|nr:hypothetical protein [uncultured Campylobacter sp.]